METPPRVLPGETVGVGMAPSEHSSGALALTLKARFCPHSRKPSAETEGSAGTGRKKRPARGAEQRDPELAAAWPGRVQALQVEDAGGQGGAGP